MAKDKYADEMLTDDELEQVAGGAPRRMYSNNDEMVKTRLDEDSILQPSWSDPITSKKTYSPENFPDPLPRTAII